VGRTGVKRLLLARAERLSALAVSWFGGEPLYGFEAIEELAPFFQVVAGRHGIRLQHHMTTNGYLLSEDVAAKLLSWDIRDFQITVDGAGHLHDTRRVARDGSKTFDTILRNLRALAKRPDPFTVAIRVNFDKATADALDEFLDTLAADFSYDERFSVVFRPMGAWGGPNDDRLTLCGTEEVRVNMRQFRERAFRRGLHIDTIARIARPGTQVCYAARPYNFIIGAHGQVMKCTVVLDTKDHNIVGTINEDGELTLNADRMALWTEPSYTTDTTCQKCYLLPPCQGLSCPLVRIEEGRRPCPMCKGDLKGELQLVQLGRPRRAEAPAAAPTAG